MKNIKKALVLVLAFAMVFGLFTMNASAASFSDDADIVNKDAVETMVQLGIINGNPDGTFAPNRIVTRAEMCKMIATALNGGTAPIFDANTVVFSDTKGHWANAYINFCFTKGIISGDSGRGGAFRPDATVTALEAAKMALVALGYNATYGGFVGADWAQNVAMAANETGLFEGLGLTNAAAPLNRDDAALLIYNAINAKMVKYENLLGIDPITGQLTSTPTITNLDDTILTAKFGVNKVVGVLVANDTYGLGGASGKEGEIKVLVRTIDGSTAGVSASAVSYKASASADLLGQEVSFFIKVSGAKTVVIGDVFATDNNKVVTTTAKLTADDVKTKGSLLKFAKDNKVEIDETADVVSEALGKDYTTYYVDNTYSSSPVTTNTTGTKLVFIDNDGDDKAEVVLKVNSYLTKVVAYSATNKNLTLSTAGVVEFKNSYGYENIAKDDIVLYTVLNGKYTFTKAETVVGKMTSYDDDTFTVGGVAYTPSKIAIQTNLNAIPSFASLGFTKNYTFYLDLAGNPVAYKEVTDTTSTTSNYAVVLNSGVTSTIDPLTGTESFAGTVKVLFTDGTVSTYTVDLLASAKKFLADGSYDAALLAVAQNLGYKKLDASGEETETTIDDVKDLNTNAKKIKTLAALLANDKNDLYVEILDNLKVGETATEAEINNAKALVNKLANKFVTYTITDGKIVLAPADSKAPGGADNTVKKNKVTLDGKVTNSTTTFIFYKDKATVVTGIANLTSDAKTVTAYIADKSGVVKFAFISDAMPTASSEKYIYVKSGASVISENDKEYKTYKAVTTDGTVITVKLESGSLTKDAVYAVNMDSNNVITGTPDLCTQDTNNLATLTAKSIFKGFVSAINGEVVTVTAEDGKKATFLATDLTVWNITGDAPYAGEITEYSDVTVVVGGSPAKIVTVFVTKATADSYAVKVGDVTIGYYYAGESVTVDMEDDFFIKTDKTTAKYWNGTEWADSEPETPFGAEETFVMPAAGVIVYADAGSGE